MQAPEPQNEPRDRIARALEQCIIEHGYAATKLIEVAERADMSPPHVRYYFRSKDAILAYSYERLLARVHDVAARLPEQDPEGWLHALGDLMLGGGRRGLEALIVLNEANLVLARSEPLRELKQSYDAQMLERITKQLASCDLPPGQTAVGAAHGVFQLLTGLMLNLVLAATDAGSDSGRQVYRDHLALLLRHAGN